MKKANSKRLEKLMKDIEIAKDQIENSEIMKKLQDLEALLEDDNSPFKNIQSLKEELKALKMMNRKIGIINLKNGRKGKKGRKLRK
jgi:hypothetical protein